MTDKATTAGRARILVRLPVQVHKAVKRLAELDERSVNWEITQAVREHVRRRLAEHRGAS